MLSKRVKNIFEITKRDNIAILSTAIDFKTQKSTTDDDDFDITLKTKIVEKLVILFFIQTRFFNKNGIMSI